MPVEPSNRISNTPNVQREESATFQQRKKQKQTKNEDNKKPEKSGTIDIKV